MTATPADAVVLEDEYLHAAELLRDNAALRKQLDIEDARAKEILAKVLAEGETGISPDGEPLVKVRPGALVWNDDVARRELPADMIARIEVTETVTRLDKALAKDILPPAIYDLGCRQNAASVIPA